MTDLLGPSVALITYCFSLSLSCFSLFIILRYKLYVRTLFQGILAWILAWELNVIDLGNARW